MLAKQGGEAMERAFSTELRTAVFIACMLVCALACLSMFIGCSAEMKENYTDLIVDVASGSGGKTIGPDAEKLKTASYILTARGPDGVSDITGIESITGRFTLNNIRCGLWTFEAKALNQDGTQIAKGAKSLEVTRSTSSTSITLTELPGKGRLELTFAVSGDFHLPSSSEARLEIELFSQSDKTRKAFSKNLDRSSFKALLTLESIHAGSYEVSAVLYRNNEMVTSAIEAVRIIDATTTKGTIPLLTSGVSDISDVTISNDVSSPIEGTIKVQRKTTSGQHQSYLLLFEPVRLPDGIKESDLAFRWYCDGVPLPNGNSRLCEAAPRTYSRFTVMVTSAKLGSTGSASVQLRGLDNPSDPVPFTELQS